MGQLFENVNKRSEAANRKYRAFIHFLKYQKKTVPGNKKEIIPSSFFNKSEKSLKASTNDMGHESKENDNAKLP